MSFALALGVIFTAQGVAIISVESYRRFRLFGLLLIVFGVTILTIFAETVVS